MFKEFENQIWTTSGVNAVVTENSDESIDGSSQKIVFSEAGAWALSTFTPIDLENYEEVSLQVYIKPTLSRQEIFKVEINGNEYSFSRAKSGWQHVLINCQGWEDDISTIKFTSLIGSTVLFVDLIGCRKVTYETMDFDVVEAIQNKVVLDYNVSTELTLDATSGSSSLSLEPNDYIRDLTMLRLIDGPLSEEVQLELESGTLTSPLVNSYDKDTTIVTAFCPVITEESDVTEADPVCGIFISGNDSIKEDVVIPMKGVSSTGGKLKRFLGVLNLVVYIESSSKRKLMSLCRQFENAYGETFSILLDGEVLELRQSVIPVSDFQPEEVGSLPRKSYFYSVEPQPITLSTKREIETIHIDIDSEAV
ncbi:hypothetical protein [Leptospira idonii]|uniref:Uncharacterized protein n=1 Tax=Leptospira idonii TaxID=1193500 RepID=A0A4R9M6K0_9LEPT|nr:hypothetical protein [Leptospira idonii]TGN20789.1 hypothetical protein EHS15_01770 [Leptospira idonii]